MSGLGFGQLVQKLAYRCIARRFRSLAIELLGFDLHGLGVFAHVFESQRPRQPERLVLDETLDVLSPDQRQVVAEFRTIEIEQHGAVTHLLVGHLVEHFCRSGELLAQAFRKAAIDTTVVFLAGNGQCQDFLFG